MTQQGCLNKMHAVVTGGGTGLGLGIATAMVDAGARVTIVGRRGDVVQQAADSLGDTAGFEVADIAELSAIPDLVHRLEARAPVDILINSVLVRGEDDQRRIPDLRLTDQSA